MTIKQNCNFIVFFINKMSKVTSQNAAENLQKLGQLLFYQKDSKQIQDVFHRIPTEYINKHGLNILEPYLGLAVTNNEKESFEFLMELIHTRPKINYDKLINILDYFMWSQNQKTVKWCERMCLDMIDHMSKQGQGEAFLIACYYKLFKIVFKILDNYSINVNFVGSISHYPGDKVYPIVLDTSEEISEMLLQEGADPLLRTKDNSLLLRGIKMKETDYDMSNSLNEKVLIAKLALIMKMLGYLVKKQDHLTQQIQQQKQKVQQLVQMRIRQSVTQKQTVFGHPLKEMNLICPICQNIYTYPVVNDEFKTSVYDKKCLEEWIQKNGIPTQTLYTKYITYNDPLTNVKVNYYYSLELDVQTFANLVDCIESLIIRLSKNIKPTKAIIEFINRPRADVK